MGNSFGCSASGERLVSAARDGDLAEARALLEINPLLAKYSTFGALNSPLHFAAAKGHNEIVSLLLQNGADVNIRNYCGQTALMQACRFGHWEIVQTLLLYKANVGRADYLNRRTAFHFAAVNGHARCLRLLVSDYIPSIPLQLEGSLRTGEASHEKSQLDKIALSKLVSKAADGGITALHLAALYGRFDCVQLLLDLHANVSATTFHYGTAIDFIGAGSTPLHYAACGGSLHCCQVLIAKGASRTVLNCNGWIPWDVARVWGRHWLESLLSPNTQASLPSFPTSRFWSLPLMSILKIARDLGLEDGDLLPECNIEHCAVCLERKCTVAAEGCGHELCTKCALYLCSTSSSYTEASGPPGSVPCPMCRHGIISFVRLENCVNPKDVQACSISLCTSYRAETSEESNLSGNTSRASRNRVSPISGDSFRALSCTGFSGLSLPMCACSETLPDRPVNCNNDSALGDNVSDVESSSSLSNSPDGPNMNLDISPVCQFSVTPWRCKLASNQ